MVRRADCQVLPVSPAGRPEIGKPINVRFDDKLLAKVDAKAHRLAISRAELIRRIVGRVLADPEASTDYWGFRNS